ncbi:hypothetical protein B0T18DRAFT_487786 [Schizothecium vesticola]|uniref:Uncharacterized protein n=1 Tax=Schizothecium vesticola TaxID=314040 RepID=A0AA40K8U1_9PEZI|nr:hypothetical protein B0T18DRAFT_487786 [Schizothecium vesticola]
MYSATPQRRNNYDHPHSDLEVVPHAADSDKYAIPSSPYSDHDKILVPQQPYYQKEVVEQNAYGVGGYYNNNYNTNTNNNNNNNSPAAAAAAGYGNGDEGQGAAAPIPPTGRREKILGLRRKTFFILVWVISIALAIAIGVGAGVGASASRNNNTAAAAAANGTATGVREEITAGAGPAAPSQNSGGGGANTAGGPSTSPLLPTTLPTTISPSSQSSSTTAPPPLKTGGVGGRCSNQWGADCVCLDSGICRDVWRGTPYTGYEGNWPCPADPNNVMACVVKPCLGKAKGSQCLWREACRELNPAPAGSAPICPGDGEFLCCAHEWV